MRNGYTIREEHHEQAGGAQVQQEVPVQAVEPELRRGLMYSFLKFQSITILFYLITWFSISRMTDDFLEKYFLAVTCVFSHAFYLCHHYLLREDIRYVIETFAAGLGLQELSNTILISFQTMYFLSFLHFFRACMLDR